MSLEITDTSPKDTGPKFVFDMSIQQNPPITKAADVTTIVPTAVGADGKAVVTPDEIAGIKPFPMELFDSKKNPGPASGDKFTDWLSGEMRKEMAEMIDAAKPATKPEAPVLRPGTVQPGGDIKPVKYEEPKPVIPLKPLDTHYSNATNASNAAIEHGVPLVVRIGAPWCPPCMGLEGQPLNKPEATPNKDAFWPKFEKAHNAGALKVAALKVNGDIAKDPAKASQAESLLAADVEGYPTVKIVIPHKIPGKENQFTYEVIASFGDDQAKKYPPINEANINDALNQYNASKPKK